MASTRRSSSGREGDQQERHTLGERHAQKSAGTSAVACRTTSAGLASTWSVPATDVGGPPVPAARSRRAARRLRLAGRSRLARDVQAGHPGELRVGLSGQGLLDLGQALALGLELLDRHDLEQVPTAIQRRTPPHLRRPVDQPQRRVVADRPTVRHVPHPAVRGPVVPLRQRRRDGIRQLVDRPQGPVIFMTVLYPAHVTLSNRDRVFLRIGSEGQSRRRRRYFARRSSFRSRTRPAARRQRGSPANPLAGGVWSHRAATG